MNLRKSEFRLAKENYFNGDSDSCLIHENFNLITAFIQDLVDAYIP